MGMAGSHLSLNNPCVDSLGCSTPTFRWSCCLEETRQGWAGGCALVQGVTSPFAAHAMGVAWAQARLWPVPGGF